MTYVFAFDHAHDRPPREAKDLLGGKGANLAEMTSVLKLPVPPGFTISTEACRAYVRSGWPDGLEDEIAQHVAELEKHRGQTLGDRDDPLLVSVRSGAKFSMPGMMDTVLDLGLNDETVAGLAQRTDPRFAYDSYRRFVMMYSRVVLGVADDFEERFEGAKALAGVRDDASVPPTVLQLVVNTYKDLVLERTGKPFPQDPQEQLRGAVEAVFRSWSNPRAVAYRNREHIAHDLGTAVNVQAMVFGNRDERSGTGVAFTREPATGASGAYGDFLVNAQGEDVVAGIRTTLPISALADVFPTVHAELVGYLDRLEEHYRDMCDVEFTIEQGKLWMLQTRVGKRSGAAALRLAVAMTNDDRIALSRTEALARVRPEHVDQVLHPRFEGAGDPIAKGLAASPGGAVGNAYFTADDALAASERGEDVILVRVETSPDDVRGMQVSKGILTTRGGLVSHAAVVARGWGIPAVVGAESIVIAGKNFSVDGLTVREGQTISIDGTTGTVMLGALELVDASPPAEFDTIMEWADEVRQDRIAIRANADTGPDAARARQWGATGIGLCRTEHMFLGERLPYVQKMILATDPEDEVAALDALAELQRSDFVEILEAMDGLPVTVRLLDPPLHEFLPGIEEIVAAETKGVRGEEAKLVAAARLWQEENPMLGTRGVRLGIVKDGLYRMQARALAEAVVERVIAGGSPTVEIMIPLVVDRAELDLVRRWVSEEVDSVLGAAGVSGEIHIGTMIETPRAALLASEIAKAADFFSFGTNDLTQMTFGFSRDDVEGRMMSTYLEQSLLDRDPFDTIDRRGVGQLVRMGTETGRAANPNLLVGVCGEHGGDPESIALFVELGLDYVSCSPFRVPVARLAAAHALLEADGETDVGA
ncbi:MAG: pyruvate, phosphate dikinase [Actinomycetota bacterium]|nr:pyruvate, phosphate dikinase [Actinomycetota bacterium]